MTTSGKPFERMYLRINHDEVAEKNRSIYEHIARLESAISYHGWTEAFTPYDKKKKRCDVIYLSPDGMFYYLPIEDVYLYEEIYLEDIEGLINW